MSTLARSEIIERVEKKELISSEFEPSRIREACYEARISNEFFNITESNSIRTVIADGDYYILRPNNQAVCITKEYFDIPLDIIARVLLVGDYFSLGIAPVNTYADPGFKGKLGIVLTNTSSNYLKLKVGEPIAKIEFSQLLSRCDKGYVGQHGGDVKIWPFRLDLVATKEELRIKGIVPESDGELIKVYGDTLWNTIVQTRSYKKYFAFSLIGSSVIPLLLIWGIQEKWNFTSPVWASITGILTGVISNFVFAALGKLVTTKRRK